MNIPFITTSQMIEVDRLMVEKYKITLIQMMENAGRNLSILAYDKFLKDLNDVANVTILCGTGGNGGGALVCARHLHNRGVNVVVCITKNISALKSVTAHQLRILQNLKIKIIFPEDLNFLNECDLIIDGIIGYSLKEKPNKKIAGMIDWANKIKCPKLSLDIPTGINAATGEIYSIAVKADATMTLALPKSGFQNPNAVEYFGELYLADISVPKELYNEDSFNVEVGNIFEKNQIIKL